MNYQGITTEKDIETYITLNSITTNILGVTGQVVSDEDGNKNSNTTLIVLVVILVIANVAWFIYFKRKRKQ